jgi:hypothetical protein
VELAKSPLLATKALRQALADAVMSGIMITNPLVTLYLNFLGDGGLFKGDAFLEALRNILEKKVAKSPVLFQDLPMDFACVACDITARELKMYTRHTHPNMEVAEAVRRSMSIPFFFEPRRQDGHEIVDGGVMDNFPLGFFLARKNGSFANSVADMQRVKIGFGPGSMGLGPPVEFEKMLDKMLPAKGLIPLDVVEVALFNRTVNTSIANMQESPLLDAMLGDFTETAKYYPLTAGLEGQSAIDFNITEAKFRKMCSKGWKGAIDTINAGVRDGNLLLSGSLDSVDPYAP